VPGRAGRQGIQSKIPPFVHEATIFGTLGLQFDLNRFCQKQITGTRSFPAILMRFSDGASGR